MNYWLLKSEPHVWSWNDQVDKGIETWTGVRNYQARNYMRTIQVGDLALFYHSTPDKKLVGIVRIVKTAYPDSTDETGKFVCVDVETVAPLKRPISLAELKADPACADLPLLKQPRLSVMPISLETWKHLYRV